MSRGYELFKKIEKEITTVYRYTYGSSNNYGLRLVFSVLNRYSNHFEEIDINISIRDGEEYSVEMPRYEKRCNSLKSLIKTINGII